MAAYSDCRVVAPGVWGRYNRGWVDRAGNGNDGSGLSAGGVGGSCRRVLGILAGIGGDQGQIWVKHSGKKSFQWLKKT